uniref:Acyltransferase n=1 Tax=Mesocestoides corti TaxID=53468 RepID=A0A5K3EFT7_MESCO
MARQSIFRRGISEPGESDLPAGQGVDGGHGQPGGGVGGRSDGGPGVAARPLRPHAQSAARLLPHRPQNGSSPNPLAGVRGDEHVRPGSQSRGFCPAAGAGLVHTHLHLLPSHILLVARHSVPQAAQCRRWKADRVQANALPD